MRVKMRNTAHPAKSSRRIPRMDAVRFARPPPAPTEQSRPPPQVVDPVRALSRKKSLKDAPMNNLNTDDEKRLPENPAQAADPSPVENLFQQALRARNEMASSPTARVAKAPSRIKPTTKVKGWFHTHPDVEIGPIDVFNPKEEGGFSDDPVFILPDLAAELRAESSQFENAIREVNGYLVVTRSGASYLVLVPLPDAATGRYHPAVEQKIDALEAARTGWKRLEWNKDERQYDEYTAKEEVANPKWPEDVSDVSILTRAFGERNVIKHRDDPLLVKFRGEA